MNVIAITSFSEKDKSDIRRLWEENMHESWDDYNGSDMFVVIHNGEFVGGFAVYRDNSDDIDGIFCSGWSGRHKNVPIADILKQLTVNVGDVYFKTDQRTAKFLLEKIAKRVKTTDRFVYYILKR